MDRKHFIKTLALFPLASTAMKINELSSITAPFGNSDKMPVLFLGHGSPMNAIEENEFVTGFRTIGKDIQKPNAILCISAHWETSGTFVTAMNHPRTIHDFGGFPQALFDVQYPAPGSKDLAIETKSIIKKTTIGLDEKWGLDHGAWSVIKHLYPNADIPVIQMSIDYTQPAQYHYDLAKELSSLRKKGVLIIGSGNMVHNLGKIAWDKMNTDNYAFDWAIEASSKMKKYILDNNHQQLINFKSQGTAFDLAIPSPEHYLPLLYTLALKSNNDQITLFNDKAVAGSLTMTSVKIG
ncbi:MAG: 4,5-DOPA dioxygenase extradiol [Bacteroidia bacterium]